MAVRSRLVLWKRVILIDMEGFAQKVRNTTHGSGWILSDPFYEMPSGCDSEIPSTAVGGWFRSFLQKNVRKNMTRRLQGLIQTALNWSPCYPPVAPVFCGLSFGRKDRNHPPTAVDGVSEERSLTFGRNDLNKPPTAVGGISFVLMCCLFGGTQIVAQGKPTYEAARVTSKLMIDGQLTEKAWREATPISQFVNNRDGSSSNLKTDKENSSLDGDDQRL